MSGSVSPIILAAGDSARIAYPKALLPIGQDTFLTRILGKLKGLEFPDPIVVLGRHAARIQPIVADLQVRLLINPDPSRGQLSSIQLALANIDPSCGGCLLWPVDQPEVSAGLVKDLIRLFRSTGARLVLPCCGNRGGHPTIFHRDLFQELLDAPAGEGAKKVVQRHHHQAALLQTDETAILEDIDTPEDYRRLAGESLETALARRGF